MSIPPQIISNSTLFVLLTYAFVTAKPDRAFAQPSKTSTSSTVTQAPDAKSDVEICNITGYSEETSLKPEGVTAKCWPAKLPNYKRPMRVKSNDKKLEFSFWVSHKTSTDPRMSNFSCKAQIPDFEDLNFACPIKEKGKEPKLTQREFKCSFDLRYAGQPSTIEWGITANGEPREYKFEKGKGYEYELTKSDTLALLNRYLEVILSAGGSSTGYSQAVFEIERYHCNGNHSLSLVMEDCEESPVFYDLNTKNLNTAITGPILDLPSPNNNTCK